MEDIEKNTEIAREKWNAAHPLESRATKLLIGKKEQSELIKIAEEWDFFKCPEKMFRGTDGKRVEFRGLKVYCVDDESYCEVAA